LTVLLGNNKLNVNDESDQQLERALELINDDTTVMGHLADPYFARHDWRKAPTCIKRILKQDRKERSNRENQKIKAETGDK